MTLNELQRVKEWAESKIATGDEPPWSWYQHMKLIESLDAIIKGMRVVTPHAEGLPQLEEQPGNGRLRVVSDDRQETFQRHQDQRPVRLPM